MRKLHRSKLSKIVQLQQSAARWLKLHMRRAGQPCHLLPHMYELLTLHLTSCTLPRRLESMSAELAARIYLRAASKGSPARWLLGSLQTFQVLSCPGLLFCTRREMLCSHMQKAFGKCSADWMKGWCEVECGACSDPLCDLSPPPVPMWSPPPPPVLSPSPPVPLAYSPPPPSGGNSTCTCNNSPPPPGTYSCAQQVTPWQL